MNANRGWLRRAMATALAAATIVGGSLTGCTSQAQDRGLPNGLPETFQVVDGTVSNAITGSGKNWSFTVTVADAEAQKAAVQKLTENGFSEVGRSTSGDTTTVALANEKSGINATLLLTKRDEDHLVVYNLIDVK